VHAQSKAISWSVNKVCGPNTKPNPNPLRTSGQGSGWSLNYVSVSL